MAFVNRTERKPAVIRSFTSDHIGPGSYIKHQEIKSKLAFAPFNSTA